MRRRNGDYLFGLWWSGPQESPCQLPAAVAPSVVLGNGSAFYSWKTPLGEECAGDGLSISLLLLFAFSKIFPGPFCSMAELLEGSG